MTELAAPATVTLSLVSHTNVGKTTLARTLLRRDIGEVRDEAHVTLDAEPHTMLVSAAGDRLILWDTPGFGDSQRLAQRLARAANPVGWFLNEVWDRWRHRAWWSSQLAVRNVLEQADAVLYLVNAGEDPHDALYIESELRVLALLHKPVLVLLNQTGPLRAADVEAAELERWRSTCAGRPGVHGVLALDAFTRCWVQEGSLLRAVAGALPAAPAAALARLHTAWAARQREVWMQSMAVLATRLARAAADREAVAEGNWSGRLRTIGQSIGQSIGESIGLRRDGNTTPREVAMQALAERLAADIRRSTEAVIRLHGLEGSATDQVLANVAGLVSVREPLPEGKAAVLGGLVTGALAGLKADLASGGLTLGGGMLAGGLIGALGAAGLARGYNLVRGQENPSLAWTDAVLDDLSRAALLTYLAIAHHGRGRGEWASGPLPAALSEAVDAVFATRREALKGLWLRRGPSVSPGLEAELSAELAAFLADATRAVLIRLYPESAEVFADAP